ncbi:molybdate ABC transporter substrate-binding protein [Neptunicoccus cionae]|uniref:molybdate ABC transporter substrate-binding protein n=1 Tax=Neptunicoccus cionae TaxID=2035344 RepID=UPI000C767CF2|nr:molybdate ABC transporter substrate-binding protein [Amylibacter cionae]PLS22743.1 molybdate ABC transporter substrate-binding protein [Amylibacter cionae]
MPRSRSLHGCFRRLAGVALGLAVVFAPERGTAETLTVFAAASLKNAMDVLAQDWAAETGHTASVAFAGSSTLARQIELGAPADVFISANTDWMNRLETRALVATGTRVDLLGNTLVLVAHGEHAPEVPLNLLAETLGTDHLAMALVHAVPAGIYGKAALEYLNLWQHVEKQVVQADNVRAALAFVATGEAPFGIVYASDAVAESRVSVAARFPRDSHAPIRYPAAAIKEGKEDLAAEFLTYLQSPPAQAVFEQQGFETLER